MKPEAKVLGEYGARGVGWVERAMEEEFSQHVISFYENDLM